VLVLTCIVTVAFYLSLIGFRLITRVSCTSRLSCLISYILSVNRHIPPLLLLSFLILNFTVLSWPEHRPLSYCRHLVSISTAWVISVTPDDTAKQTIYLQASHIHALQATPLSVKLILCTLTSYLLSILPVSVALHSTWVRIKFYLVMAEVT